MRIFIIATLSLGFLLGPISASQADDPRCEAPPYGMTIAAFRAFVQAFGALVVPTRVLPALCNAKYGGTDRTGLYNLGFTDQDINSRSLDDLAKQFMVAMFGVADKIHQ